MNLVNILDFFENEMDFDMSSVGYYQDLLDDEGESYTIDAIAEEASDQASRDLDAGLKHRYVDYSKVRNEDMYSISGLITAEDIYKLSEKFGLGL